MLPFWGWRGSVGSVVVVIAVVDDDAHGGVLVGRAVKRCMVLRHAWLVWHAGGRVDDDVPRERGHEWNPLVRHQLRPGGWQSWLIFDAYREVVATAAVVMSLLSTSDQSPKFELDSMVECAHDGDVRARGGRRLRTRRRRIKSTNMYK